MEQESYAESCMDRAVREHFLLEFSCVLQTPPDTLGTEACQVWKTTLEEKESKGRWKVLPKQLREKCQVLGLITKCGFF